MNPPNTLGLPSHIFVVGASRSGTKFLMNTLNRHSLVNISPETHWFSRLIHRGFIRTARETGDLKNDRNLQRLLDKMFNHGIFGTFWKSPPVTREAIQRRFFASDRSFRVLFSELLDEHRQLSGKSIAGEKTPSHVFHVKTLLGWFPEARIIQMIRDPRAVLSSEMHKNAKPDYPLKKKNFLYNAGLLVAVSIGWYLAMRKDRRYKAVFSNNYLSIRYEDLQNNHQQTVESICRFLSLEFEQSMLNPPREDSSFATDGVTDDLRQLPRWMLSATELFLGRTMKRYGY